MPHGSFQEDKRLCLLFQFYIQYLLVTILQVTGFHHIDYLHGFYLSRIKSGDSRVITIPVYQYQGLRPILQLHLPVSHIRVQAWDLLQGPERVFHIFSLLRQIKDLSRSGPIHLIIPITRHRYFIQCDRFLRCQQEVFSNIPVFHSQYLLLRIIPPKKQT